MRTCDVTFPTQTEPNHIYWYTCNVTFCTSVLYIFISILKHNFQDSTADIGKTYQKRRRMYPLLKCVPNTEIFAAGQPIGLESRYKSSSEFRDLSAIRWYRKQAITSSSPPPHKPQTTRKWKESTLIKSVYFMTITWPKATSVRIVRKGTKQRGHSTTGFVSLRN
jgi:hypothetical protein